MHSWSPTSAHRNLMRSSAELEHGQENKPRAADHKVRIVPRDNNQEPVLARKPVDLPLFLVQLLALRGFSCGNQPSTKGSSGFEVWFSIADAPFRGAER